MDLDHAREFVRVNHHAILHTFRADGSPQMSPVACGVDDDGFVVVSTRETAMKTKNLKRDARASLETFRVLRASNLALLESIPEKLWDNYGTHQERGKETVTHIVSMYAGHDLNHLRQVEAIVKGT